MNINLIIKNPFSDLCEVLEIPYYARNRYVMVTLTEQGKNSGSLQIGVVLIDIHLVCIYNIHSYPIGLIC